MASSIQIPASGGGTPGGSDTQVQFNDAGAFGGDSGLVYDKTSDILGLGDDGGSFTILGHSGSVGNGAGVDLYGGFAVSGNNNGGNVSFNGGPGHGSGDGGDVQIAGGSSDTGESGSVDIYPGSITGLGTYGALALRDGTYTNQIFVIAGSGVSTWQVHDADGSADRIFITGTPGNTPNLTIAPPSGGTVSLTGNTVAGLTSVTTPVVIGNSTNKFTLNTGANQLEFLAGNHLIAWDGGNFYPNDAFSINSGIAGQPWNNVYAAVHQEIGTNAQAMVWKQATVALTTNSGGATATATNLIPAGSVVYGVDTRVTTILAGVALTTFQIGDGTTTNLFAATAAIAADSTTDLTTHLATFKPTLYKTATSVVLTANAGVFSSGVIRITVHYYTLSAATS